MASIGKIKLSEVAPNHPFVGRSIVFVSKPQTKDSSTSEGTKKMEQSKPVKGGDRSA